MINNRTKWIKRIILIVLVLGIISYFGYMKIKALKSSSIPDKNISDVSIEMAHNPDLAINNDLINEKYKDVPSDIEGLTQLEKVSKGLEPYDGSDTDRDGLTDKEEIEVYNSDPLKTSTSGDLYSDGYKVANSLDLNKFYEDSQVVFNNIPEELLLHARYASDNRATTGQIPYKEDGAYYAFLLSGFAGDGLAYDLTKICAENNKEYGDIGAYIKDYVTNKYVDCDYEIVDNYLKIKCDFDSSKGYKIYITDKSMVPSAFSRMLFGDEIAEEFKRLANANEFEIYKGYHKDAEEGLIVMPLPILASFGANISICRPLVYYNETADAYQNGSAVDQLVVIAHKTVNNDEIDVKLKPTTIVKIVNLYNKLEAIGDGFFNGMHDSIWHNALLDYILLSEYNDSLPKEEKPQNYQGMADFDIVEDTLPFKNFKTTIGVAGNCMGISTLITKINNTGSNPSAGTSEYSNIEWDISKDAENGTLMDEILNDYKDADFIRQHKNVKGFVSTDLSEGEKEFLKMIGAYFIDGNAIAQKNCPKLTQNGYAVYSLYNLRQACKKNLEDKVLTLCMFSGQSGHAVNVYGYVDELDTGGEFYLNVYDNNFPGDESKGLKVMITPSDRGGFDYNFSVPGADGYGYSSYDNEYMFVLMDEDYNIIFGSEDDLERIPEPVGQKSKAQEILEQMDF